MTLSFLHFLHFPLKFLTSPPSIVFPIQDYNIKQADTFVFLVPLQLLPIMPKDIPLLHAALQLKPTQPLWWQIFFNCPKHIIPAQRRSPFLRSRYSALNSGLVREKFSFLMSAPSLYTENLHSKAGICCHSSLSALSVSSHLQARKEGRAKTQEKYQSNIFSLPWILFPR